MSKLEFKKYIKSQNKENLEAQLLELYTKFKDVKEYYNFAFNPREDKLVHESKFRINKEYFPAKGRKIKARRSVAQKHIKHFTSLGVDKYIIADLMIYNIDILNKYHLSKPVKQESFFRSVAKSYFELINFCIDNKLLVTFGNKIDNIGDDLENSGIISEQQKHEARIIIMQEPNL